MNTNSAYCWPAAFPKGIPEELDIKPAEGKVYRLVKNSPPAESDFKMHRDDCPGYHYSKEDFPKSYGVSFWAKLNRVLQIKQNYPNAEQFGNMAIVCGELCRELGVIPIDTPRDGHVTLWVQNGAYPHLHINRNEGTK
jgi:hypothetical protein